MTREPGIYLIVNHINNKLYIGSAVDLDKRVRSHINALRANKHNNQYLQRSWNEYGEDNFGFAELEIVSDKLNLIRREQFWLDYTKCYDPSKGYNLCAIAGSSLGLKVSEETKKKMGNAHKGLKRSEETKTLMSAKLKGNKRWLGKKHNKETKLKMSLSAKGKPRSEEYRLKISTGLKEYYKAKNANNNE